MMGNAPPRSRLPALHQRGVALLLALIILALVATLTATMVWQQNRAVQVEAAERARVQAAWILSGALDWARLILREDQRNNQQRARPYDSLDEVWATPLAEARLSSFLAADKDNNAESGPEAFISGGITDAQARYNVRGLVNNDGKINAVQVQAFQQLCDLAGAPTDLAGRLAQAMESVWSLKSQDGGARTAADANPPLRPARLADLVWLGADASTLARLEPWVDLLPFPTPVNVNTAPREALLAAIDKLDMGSADRLIQSRQRKPFESLADVKAMLGPDTQLDEARVSVASSYFWVAGRLRLEDRVLEERSLLVRRDGRVDVLQRERRSFVQAPRLTP